MIRVRIIIFAKAPWPGAVKTRLIPALGAEGAARLARLMLTETVMNARQAKVGPVELCMSPGPRSSRWRGIMLPKEIEVSYQGGGDLGDRMERAARRGLAQDDAVLLIGTDCPDLSVGRLRYAAQALRNFDSVIQPTVDGGYALLGLTRSAPALFSGIPWGSEGVARITLSRLDALDWSTLIGDVLYDIDEPRDLTWLPDSWRDALSATAICK